MFQEAPEWTYLEKLTNHQGIDLSQGQTPQGGFSSNPSGVCLHDLILGGDILCSVDCALNLIFVERRVVKQWFS